MADLSGQATDIDIHAARFLRIREITNTLIAKHNRPAFGTASSAM